MPFVSNVIATIPGGSRNHSMLMCPRGLALTLGSGSLQLSLDHLGEVAQRSDVDRLLAWVVAVKAEQVRDTLGDLVAVQLL